MFTKIKRWWKVILITGMSLTALGWWGAPFLVSLPDKLTQPQPLSPVFLAADGTPLRQLLAEDGQRTASPAAYKDLPETLVHALLAAEDKRFFQHGGVDTLAILRAASDNMAARRTVSGASTLTQQLIKISSTERRQRGLSAKIQEALQARRLEMTWSKEEILAAYFSRVSFGNLFTGVISASQGYLNKPLRDLTPAECAFLAALPQSPTRHNPYRSPQGVRKRQLWILQRMRALDWLSEEALELASQEKLALRRYYGGFDAPHATELAGLSSEAGKSAEIRTTIERDLQSRVESIMTRRLELLKDKNVTQGAVVVLENSTGRVLALAGSRDFFSSAGGQINGAWSPHSPGSALKPFTYLLALQRGYTTASIIPDLPVEYATPTGLYRPENYNRQFHGPVTLRTALGSSLNIPAVRVLQRIGGESQLVQSLQELGITTLDQPASHYGLGLTIGNAPVRLLELVNAYACLARLGEYKPWTLLAAEPSKPEEASRLHPASTCYLLADVLSDNQARLSGFSFHSVIRMPFRCAVKTGTSTNYRDNWTMGFTPEYTVGVWVGNFDNTPMTQVSGVTGAGPIFRDVFLHLQERKKSSWYTQPKDVVTAQIDPRNGLLIPTPGSSTMVRAELFLEGSLPPAAIDSDYEPDTRRAWLPLEYTDWARQANHWLTGLVAIRPASGQDTPRILSPASGTIVILDPDLQENGSRLLLRSAGQGQWSSATLQLQREDDRTYARLTPGKHTLTLRNDDTGESASANIEVRHPPSLMEKLHPGAPPQQ